ncbi:hypothetical protein [Actinoplanes sp. URMC 104]
MEVLQLLARGLSDAEPSAELVVSDGTTKTRPPPCGHARWRSS